MISDHVLAKHRMEKRCNAQRRKAKHRFTNQMNPGAALGVAAQRKAAPSKAQRSSTNHCLAARAIAVPRAADRSTAQFYKSDESRHGKAGPGPASQSKAQHRLQIN